MKPVIITSVVLILLSAIALNIFGIRLSSSIQDFKIPDFDTDVDWKYFKDGKCVDYGKCQKGTKQIKSLERHMRALSNWKKSSVNYAPDIIIFCDKYTIKIINGVAVIAIKEGKNQQQYAASISDDDRADLIKEFAGNSWK